MRRLDPRGAARRAASGCTTRASRRCWRCAATRRATSPTGSRRRTASRYASDLVGLLARSSSSAIGAACHPEKHPEAPDPATDLAYLRRKVDAGAEFLITQLFFDNTSYFTFVQRAREAGIMVPIVPGIMPITNVEQIERFTKLCGAVIPPGLQQALDLRRGNDRAVQDFGVAYATLQCAELLRKGAPGIHFYTLNRSTATASILRALRLHEPWRLT